MKPHQPTNETNMKVELLASMGVPTARIAKYIGISKTTLFKYYSDIIEVAQVDKIVKVANSLYDNAVYKNNVTAQIFFLKTQGGWRENLPEPEEKEEHKKIEIEIIHDNPNKTNSEAS